MRDGKNRRPAGRAAQLAVFAAALIAAMTVAAADGSPPATVRVPWTVRHELSRAEVVLRRENARWHVGGDVQVVRQGEEVVLRMPASVVFSPDSESLRPGLRAAQMLAIPTELLRQRRHLMMRIEVFTDNIGGVQLNQQLSARRAAVLASAMQTAGISTHRVQAYGRGAAQALAANDSAQGRAMNRRVEFVFARIGSQAALAPPPADAVPPASAGLRPAPAVASSGG